MQRTAPHRLVLVVAGLAVIAVIPLVAACSHQSPDIGVASPADKGAGNQAPSYVSSEVDKEAAPYPDNPVPHYLAPGADAREHSSEMRRLPDFEGTVVAAFVVDTTGRVDMTTFKVVRSDNDLFTGTVKEAVRLSLFSPAEKGGRPVRELVTTEYRNSDPEKEATQYPGGPMPRYPENLQIAGVVGTVVAAFVIDTAGRVDMSTFKVIRSDNVSFTRAVKEAIALRRFHPAEKDGRPVKELLATPFTFDMKDRDVSSGCAPQSRRAPNEPQ